MNQTQAALPIVLPNLPQLLTHPDALPWEPFRPGIAIHRLYSSTPPGSAAALLRYEPGAIVPWHRHLGYEHIWVLAGSQSDDRGTYTTGTLVINPPDTCHQVTSPEGCIVLIIWEKPIQFEGVRSEDQQ
ncbi:cupin domain-containing protein [Egbenema bharatensis]|uniref:cupin domain-containing protein n=1 Tax=Egbenema bharatensis TaxID=3463334 RepID=UPI003A845963